MHARTPERYNSFSMAKLGFLGLGLMGYPMARNLLRAGHEVALWSNTADKARKLAAEEKGCAAIHLGRWQKMPTVIFLCVGDTAMAHRSHPWGPTASSKARARVRWWPTPAPSVPARAVKIGEALKAKGVDFLDAPCTGIDSGGEWRHSDLHGRRRPRRFSKKPSHFSNPWASASTIAAARAWACRPS